MVGNPMKKLVSFVTGGASGLGKRTVKYLAKHKGCVVLVDLPESTGHETANSIDGNVIFAPCDVTSERDVSNALSLCEEKFGRLDLAVNCAGLVYAFKIANPLRNNCFQLEEFKKTYESNVYGTFNVTRLAARLMSKNEPKSDDKQRGVIINTGSISSEHGCIGQTAFSAAKGAISAMTLPIARDLAPMGIRVLTIAPGIFMTPLVSEVCLTLPNQEYYLEQMIFPERFGKPVEFAEMVEAIIRNPMLNGEIIKLSGGLRFHAHVKTVGEKNEW